MSAPSASRRTARRIAAAIALLAVGGVALAIPSLTQAPAVRPLPASHPPSEDSAAVLADAERALDAFYRESDGRTADAGWHWATYFAGLEAVRELTGDRESEERLLAWGRANAWDPRRPPSPTSNPDSRAAIQVWLAAEQAGLPADLAIASRVMHADLRIPEPTYWWIDALFMGLPLWPAYAARTGDDSYSEKGRSLYDFLKTDGRTTWRSDCRAGGLFDESEDLWWRDCSFVGRRDPDGIEIFWGRGNGWVLAAMARTLDQLPPDSPARDEYEMMLARMAERLIALRGADGMWRSSLLNPALFPDPETSATSLFTYALAYGVRTGILDPEQFRPAIDRAWAGLSGVALQQDGFLAYCQPVGDQPGPPSTTVSTPFCVGAFALAAAEVARLLGAPAPAAATGGF